MRKALENKNNVVFIQIILFSKINILFKNNNIFYYYLKLNNFIDNYSIF